MNKKKFGFKLKELREKANHTQSDLGEYLDVGMKQIQRYEKGELLPDHEKVQLLCERYKYDFVSLIYGRVTANDQLENEEDVFANIAALREFVMEQLAAVSGVSVSEMSGAWGRKLVEVLKRSNKAGNVSGASN